MYVALATQLRKSTLRDEYKMESDKREYCIILKTVSVRSQNFQVVVFLPVCLYFGFLINIRFRMFEHANNSSLTGSELI